VAEVKPLKLKVEKAQKVRRTLLEDPFVDVIVDLPFFHAEEVFTYKLIEESEGAQVGDLVGVPFGNGIAQGVILSRSPNPSTTGKIKAIHSLISSVPVFTPEQITLARAIAKRYATDTWSILRSMTPPFSVTGERGYVKISRNQQPISMSNFVHSLPKSLLKRLQSGDRLRELVLLPASQDPYMTLMKIARSRATLGKVVVVLPDQKDLLASARTLENEAIPYIALSSAQTKSERYGAYLQANCAASGIILTLRNGTLLHLGANDTLILFNEVESHHYERRSPTWNSRDIALLRSSANSVIFVSNSPSVEIVRQVEGKWLIPHLYPRTKIKRLSFLAADGREPEIFPQIREALNRGSVLISVGNAGYVEGFSCAKCRTKATCSCGGKLRVPKEGANPECALCSEVTFNWHCQWCNGEKMWVTHRGAVRTASEFGRAFPQAKVIQSSGDSQIASLPEGKSLVIATLGAEPVGMYAGIFVLDAQLAYSQVQLRSQEEVRSHWFKLLSLLQPDGAFYLSLPSSETISQGLVRADSYDLASREMHERHDAKLPPYFKLMICEGPFSDLAKISELLEVRGFISFPLPQTKDGKGRLLVKYEVAKGEEISEFFASLQRVRAAQKREVFALRFDPYSIA